MNKNRAPIIIVLTAIVLYGLMNYFTQQSTSVEEQSPSRVDSAPQISTVPGQNTDNVRYRELQQQANEEKAAEAKKEVKSFVPTLVNKAEDDGLLDRILEEKRREKEEQEQARQNALKQAQELSQKRLAEQQARIDRLRREQEQKRQAADMARQAEKKAQEQSKLVEEHKRALAQKIAQINTAESYTPKQAYVAGSANATTNNAQGVGSVQGVDQAGSLSSQPLYKAGTILYAVVETSMNTDEPAPILAKITSGPLAGSRLIGSSRALGSQWAQSVVIEFSTVSVPYLPNSQSIQAIAVDPVTARTALADEVNHHYLQRYGSLFFSKLLEGYAQAIQDSGTTTETDSNTGNETVTNSEKSDSEKFFIALGNVGTALSSQVATGIDRPVTITINQGSPIGLLLLSDFTLQS